MVRAGERVAIDIDGGARWERLAPVTLDNLDCLELICAPHRSICLDLTFAILPPIDGPYATLDLIAHNERMCVLDVDGLLAPRRIGMAGHRERQPSPAARAFIELARSVCGPLGATGAA